MPEVLVLLTRAFHDNTETPKLWLTGPKQGQLVPQERGATLQTKFLLARDSSASIC